ncbi:MAG: DUF3105 domain-containing protein [Dehalococcoidia bacterium]|nr:DUF3105 domain-containing protein [Dehalococcoidia bacterium]
MTVRRQAKPTRRRPPEQVKRRSNERVRKRLVRYGAIAAVGVIGALIIVALILPSISRGMFSNNASPTGVPQGPGAVFADMGQQHIPQAEHAADNTYNSVPPTSGNHWPVWAKCGVHDEPVANELQVHNLEHGFVVIQYKTDDKATIDQLKQVAEKLPGWPNFYMLAPYPTMEPTIALTAWRVMQSLATVDEKAIQDFAKAHRTQGPELGAPGC